MFLFNGTHFTEWKFRQFVQDSVSIASFKVEIELILRGLNDWRKESLWNILFVFFFFCRFKRVLESNNNMDTTIIVISVGFEHNDRLQICVQCQKMRIIYEYEFFF